MVLVLDPQYVPTRQVFTDTIIHDIYLQVKEDVNACLHLTYKFALTTNSCTSRATESYVRVTACFISLHWKLQSYVCKHRLYLSHTGANNVAVLLSAFNEWEILSNPPLVTENASNKVVASSEAGCNPHICCYAQTLNLAAQKYLLH
ncbi:hypothetical protein ACJMK2_031559 [Sinanodonta woodiana]|uniref:Uncharacterized protein n=1 Tax=Sinanodonta woodiana TaxID=1069815 RepID=A0ABD3X0K9_SINWO